MITQSLPLAEDVERENVAAKGAEEGERRRRAARRIEGELEKARMNNRRDVAVITDKDIRPLGTFRGSYDPLGSIILRN